VYWILSYSNVVFATNLKTKIFDFKCKFAENASFSSGKKIIFVCYKI